MMYLVERLTFSTITATAILRDDFTKQIAVPHVESPLVCPVTQPQEKGGVTSIGQINQWILEFQLPFCSLHPVCPFPFDPVSFPVAHWIFPLFETVLSKALRWL